MKDIFEYFKEVRLELAKVKWPKFKEVLKLTLVVLIISVVMAVYVGGLDFSFTKLLELVVSK